MIKNTLTDPEKKKIFLVGGVAIVVLFVYFQLLLGPALGRIGRVRSEARQLRQSLKAVQAGLSQLPQMEKKTTRLREKVRMAEDHFPSKLELPELLERLSEVAETSDVKIVEIEPTKPLSLESGGDQPLYEEVPIALNAKSGYHELGLFINQLENSKRYFVVKDIRIKKDSSDSKRHHVDLVLQTFVRANP